MRAVQTAGTQVQVRNMVDGTLDDLDFRDRVIKMAIGESLCPATLRISGHFCADAQCTMGCRVPAALNKRPPTDATGSSPGAGCAGELLAFIRWPLVGHQGTHYCPLCMQGGHDSLSV